MTRETEKLFITVLKKLNTALDIYLESNKTSNYRLMVLQSIIYGDYSMIVYKTKSKRFTDIFYYDTEIAAAIGIEESDDFIMSNKVLQYLIDSGDFEDIASEDAFNYLQNELWRVNPIEFGKGTTGSTGDVFDFRLCVKKYIIPKYQKLLKLKY